MSEYAIVLNQLTKHYGKHRGISNLNLTVNQGELASLAQTVRVSPPPSAL